MSLASLDRRASALLVIDMQNAFCDPEGTLARSAVDIGQIRDTIPRIRSLVEAFRAGGLPVIWTRQEHVEHDAGRERKRLPPHTKKRATIAALAGTWDAEIVDELAPLADQPHLIVRKHRFGCFYETRLDALLRMLGIRSMFVVGATANACVDTTLREAYLRDYDIVAVTDCIGAIERRWFEVAQEVWERYLALPARSDAVKDWLAEPGQRVQGLGHLLLQVEDLPRSERFYIDLIGMTVRKRERFHDGRPLVVTEQGLGLTDGRPAGEGPVEHVAFEVSDVNGVAERAARAGVTILRGPEPSAYGISVYLADPDGNQIELFGAQPPSAENRARD